QSFSIGAGNIVRFIQPDSSSLALNRVIGPDPSMIFGSIQANGRVVIMNPAGIYFGPSAMVDVNGLVATTSRMNQADFLAGNLNFSIAGDVNARVINEGFVNVAQGGFAVLSAAAVENKGTIVAQGGTVVLAGTPTFTLDFFGDGLLKFASTGTVNQAPTGANALVDNSGTVQANGGRVLMTARAARDVINNVINVTGIVEARSARIENGEIVIDGGENGTTVVAGRLDVSGNEADAKGGNVTVLGGRVELAAGTDIRASGEAGGGTVLVGGGQHGQGTAYNAQTLYMDAAAVIAASATLNGDGGKVVLWADDTARVEG
ncbi:MAG: filamentous hemagglutinin N-terminal domain-containing protein, partial [Alphaproteobacteria bacterium]|nr:filamentous hemagglutinin N-terminal domain-containing protein [Alphaproteobacteria bacterium]